jgi:MFS family permease
MSKQKLAIAFTICFISIMFSGVSSMLMSVYLPVAVRNLLGDVNDENMNSVSAYINSFFLFGSMFGGFTWGYICDRIGRAKAVTFSTAFYALFTILTAFSDSWLVISIYRFLTGFGVGGVILTTNILVCELWPENKRAVAVGIVSAAMPVGFIAAGALNNLLANWHNAFLIGAIPLTMAVISAFALSESESWKAGRKSAANVQKAPGGIFSHGYNRNLLIGSLIFGTMLIGLWAVFSWAPTWVQSVTPDEARAQQLRGTTMIILASSGLLGSVASGWIANAIGQRNALVMCFAMCFIMVFVVFKLNNSITTATIAEMFVMAFFFGISQGVLAVYIPQLFPVSIRAFATGFCYNIGRLFTASVVFFIGALVDLLGGYGNAIFIFSFIFLIGLAITGFAASRRLEYPAGKQQSKLN